MSALIRFRPILTACRRTAVNPSLPNLHSRSFARRWGGGGGGAGSALSLVPFGLGQRWRHDPFTDVFKDLERLSNDLAGFNSEQSR
jgi:hypothetical protein